MDRCSLRYDKPTPAADSNQTRSVNETKVVKLYGKVYCVYRSCSVKWNNVHCSWVSLPLCFLFGPFHAKVQKHSVPAALAGNDVMVRRSQNIHPIPSGNPRKH